MPKNEKKQNPNNKIEVLWTAAFFKMQNLKAD